MIALTREEAQQVLDALEYFGCDFDEQLIETLRARLAQPDVMINRLTEEETAATMSVKGLTQPEPPCKTGSQCVGGKCTHCAKPEPSVEPVAYGVLDDDGQIDWTVEYPFSNEPGWPDSVPLYTNPPQREWQGLTRGDADLLRVIYTKNGVVQIDALLMRVDEMLRENNS